MTSYRGARPILIDEFGGLVTRVPRADLKLGVSPACQDVEFYPGGVKSRGGFEAAVDPGNTASWNGFGNLIPRDNSRKIVGLQSNGELRQASGTLDTAFGNDLFLQVSQLYGRAYISISDGKVGVAPAMVWDGTNLDPYTWGPPAIGITAADNVAAGNVAAGTRVAAVCYVLRDGTVSPPRWTAPFTTAGAKKLDLVSVVSFASSAPQVVAQMVFVSYAGTANTVWSGSDLYHLPDRMLFTAAGTGTIDFTEAELLAGVPLSEFVGYDPLPPCLGTVPYNNRMVAWGCLPQAGYQDNASYYLTNIMPEGISAANLQFDAGGELLFVPEGWATVGAGGTHGGAVGSRRWIWKIIGDGVTAIRGRLKTGLTATNVPLEAMIRLNTTYRVRVRLKKTAGCTTGRFRLDLSSLAGAFTTMTATVNASAISSSGWTNFDLALGTLGNSYGATGIQLDIYADQVIPAGEEIQVGGVAFYIPEAGAGLTATLRVSRPFEPARFSTSDGYVVVNREDGQRIARCFVLRGNLYIAKERSLWVTNDNGSSEPASWPVSQVSDTVGTYSVNGVGIGDGWVAIASRQGLYYFDGGAPQPMSREIQPDWDGINWEYGHTIWVVVHPTRRLVLIGVPTVGATSPNRIFVCDYAEGWAHKQWTIWTISGGSGQMIERSDGGQDLYIGTNDASGVILRYDPTLHADNGEVINSFYETALVGEPFGMALLLGLHVQCAGQGTVTFSHRPPDGIVRAIRQYGVQDPWRVEITFPIHIAVERTAIRVETNSATGHFDLQRLAVHEKPHPLASRGRTP